jgi:hypothetical protein
VLPANWAELEQRLGYIFGGGAGGAATAREILVQAVAGRWQVESLHDLDRLRRAVAFQKFCGMTVALEDEPGDIAFYASGLRELVQRTVARFFDGHTIAGPEWRMDPSETDRPLFSALVTDADFADVAPKDS